MTQTLPVVEHAALDAPTHLGDDQRYQVLSRLGQGGFGTVYKALDTRYGSHVAVKVLRARTPATTFRFKQEFRGLADLSHPNLVRLYELNAEGWFVVMELVDGVGLLEHLTHRGPRRPAVTVDTDAPEAPDAPAPRATDYDAVRDAFAQLARGLMALHDARKLHRDIKPSNVMVTREGRVVLLDFGLLMDEDQAPQGLLGGGAGTPGYMPLEQWAGEPLTASSDWYAVGATLHEALTGEPPTPGVPRPLDEARAAGAPDDLIALCRRLIDLDPARRPRGPEVLSLLGRPDPRPATAVSPTDLIGRDAALRALDDALDDARGAPQLVRVEGASGVGKSALAAAWLARVDARDDAPWTLRSRCLEHEHTPFKAVDGAVDAIASRLLDPRGDARREALRDPLPGASLLRRMFPVLAGVEELVPDAEPAAHEDPRVLRDIALDALRTLFARLAARGPLVLFIEDAHWGDADSARALALLLQGGIKGLLVLVTQRPSTEPTALPAALSAWLAHGHPGLTVRDVPLDPLDAADARALARACLGAETPDGDARAAQIAQESSGNPFFIRQLAGEGGGPGVTLGNVLERQLARADASVRRVVEVLSLAARPLSEEVVARAARVDADDVRPAILSAERGRLIAGAERDGQTQLETCHARVRDEVVKTLDAATSRTHHRALVDALRAVGQREPEVLLPHLLGGGDRAGASSAALEAAAKAERAFAFERAAELYAITLDLDVDPAQRASLLERRGDALANAGRSAGAAEALDAALDAGEGDPRARQVLRRRSAELWLRSGYVSRGMKGFREVLAPHGVTMPATDKDAQRIAVWRRLRLLLRGMKFTPRAEGDIAPEVLDRLDALWSATTSIAMLRFLIVDALALQHLLDALNVGEPTRVLRALAFEAAFEALLGGSYFDKRCARMVAEMERLARGFETDYFRAWSTMSRGIVGWLQGDWNLAWSACREASAMYTTHARGLVWELAVCDVYSLSAATYLGRFSDLAALVPERHRAARERGDLYASANLAFYESFVLLAKDQPAEAIRVARESIEPFLDEEFLSNQYGISYAIAQGELYRGDADAAWDLVAREWPAWKSGGMLMAQCIRVEVRYLRARAALALLSLPREVPLAADRARAARAALREDAHRLAKDRSPPAAPMSLALRAGLANIDNNSNEVLSLLRDAAAGFARCGMTLHAAAARHHRARRTRDPAELAAAEEAARALRDDGVARPERMFALALTGFPS